MATEYIFDRSVYGRLVRAARIIAGHDSVADASKAITEITGLTFSDRTIYALERGEQEPTVAQYMALTLAYRPPGGLVFWEAAFAPEIVAMFDSR